ncbi:hypothetical protein PMI01_02826 [Caulobacter sp. AP07]|uniref:DUF6265 family protein n=1 Tax=Caulobacter sp. AP07 TaxID=1144304 RepID=UPI000272252C|nr:DUF6265 family protein [Caulobacter sp. AP07]EJL31292.1 hypothetical protein PMI01_02826 [Caulobacter sp. AP07]
MKTISAVAIWLATTAMQAPNLDWMAGDWRSCGATSIVEEHWLGSGPLLAGVNLTRSPRQTTFEHLRIAPGPGGPTYYASPGGRPAVAFALKTSGKDFAVFENLAHDFPKRIAYRRDGEALVAEATDQAGHGPSWRFLPAAASPPCAPL